MIFPNVKNLRLIGVSERGTPKERVIMRAVLDCNLARYAVIQTALEADGVVPTNQLIYWFPEASIEKGHYVLLYTHAGINKVRVDDAGDTLHIFYWGRSESAWPANHTPTLAHINAISYKGLDR